MNQEIIFDTETNGLYFDVTVLHCICTYNITTGESKSFYEDSLEEGLAYLATATTLIGHNIIGYDLPVLEKLYGFKTSANLFDTLVTSRLLYPEMAKYHYPLIEQMYNEKLLSKEVYIKLRGKMIAESHSLEAWGYRVGELKGDYKKTNDFNTFTPEMLSYCEQDVKVTRKLFSKLLESSAKLKGAALSIEHDVAKIITRQWMHGWRFDVTSAEKLLEELYQKRNAVEDKLIEKYGYYEEVLTRPSYYTIEYNGESFKEVTKADAVDAAYTVLKPRYGKLITKNGLKDMVQEGPPLRKLWPFNPYSGKQVAEKLKDKFGWEPVEFTETGEAKLDEDILEALVQQIPDTKDILECHQLNKIASFISFEKQKYEERKLHKTGTKKDNKGWLEFVRGDRIHGEVVTNGAGTGRATHRKPNLAQVPSAKKMYGKECRSLFIPSEGYVAVGTDASSLELRCMGHYMFPYDGGAFSKAVVEGTKEEGTDVHTLNMKAFGCDTRDQAKTLIYAQVYGAGEEKIGKTIGVSSDELKQMMEQTRYDRSFGRAWEGVRKSRTRRNNEFFEKKLLEPNGPELVKKLTDLKYQPYPVDNYHIALCLKGRKLIENLYDNTPALKQLKDAIQSAHRQRGGLLYGLDGRPLYIRSEHAALNTLLQSAGAIICKQWMIEIHKELNKRGLQTAANQLGWIHDEFAFEVKEEAVEDFKDIPDLAMSRVREFFNFKCQLNAEVQIGKNWGDTH